MGLMSRRISFGNIFKFHNTGMAWAFWANIIAMCFNLFVLYATGSTLSVVCAILTGLVAAFLYFADRRLQ